MINLILTVVALSLTIMIIWGIYQTAPGRG